MVLVLPSTTFTANRPSFPKADMRFNKIPDDVWIEIFENISEPASLACLVRTCRRFQDLAKKPLLREIRWFQSMSTIRNIDSWKNGYKDLVALPRKLTLCLVFDTNVRNLAHPGPNDTALYDCVHLQIPSFTGLKELVFVNTSISPFAYTILALLPNLRSLTICDCTFLQLYTTFKENVFGRRSPPEEFFQFANLPITHLSLHKVLMPAENDYNPYHPLHLITAENLTSLSITWNANHSFTYGIKKWLLPKLSSLSVNIPLLTRDLIDSLVGFVQHCPLDPAVELDIDRHNLSEQQIGSAHFPLRGVVKYRGPLPIASFPGRSITRGVSQSDSPKLAHLVMNEPLDLAGVLGGLENLPRSLETLDIQIRKWDIELLFAIRSLFHDIRSLIVRFGKGTFPEDFFVSLGSNILFDLPRLHTIKLLLDESCIATNRQLSTLHQSYFATYPHHPVAADNEEPEPEPTEPSVSASALDYSDLGDYLMGWNRYCKSLRFVQVDPLRAWERRFEGDIWQEVATSPDLERV